MSEKRRDNKNRILRNGEYQYKDGRYKYTYSINGVQQSIYSWKLEAHDPLPSGKRPCKALREMVKELQKDSLDGIVPFGGGYTVIQLVNKYISLKKNLKYSTMLHHQTLLRMVNNDPFLNMRIDKVKPSDAKTFLSRMSEKDYKSSTVCKIRSLFRPAFEMAVNDDVIRKNPFNFNIKTVIQQNTEPRTALTIDEMEDFLSFVKNHKYYCKYHDAIYILFHTGLRISEFCGLTLDDIDFEKNTISVNRQMLWIKGKRAMVPWTKTNAGNRILPMERETCECFRRMISNRKIKDQEPVIDGHTGFLFYNRDGMPPERKLWDEYFRHIMSAYKKASNNPKIKTVTPHICRHTYCTHRAMGGMNPKILQYLMGHSNIQMTLDAYTHVDYSDVIAQVQRYDAGK